MTTRVDLIDQLERLDFYAYTETTHVDAAKEHAAEGGYLYGEETNRFFFCDSEDLAEGGVLRLLDDILPQLVMRGVALETIADDFEPDHYDVTVNNIRYRIHGPDVQDPAEYWRVSTERTLALVNDLLVRAGSDERVYHLGGAEDGAAVFLTPILVEFINGNRSIRDNWIPEQP